MNKVPKFIVEIEPGVWLADIQGDPGRTLVRGHAKRYATEAGARRAIATARRYRPFSSARVERW